MLHVTLHAGEPWQGLVDRSGPLQTRAYDFGASGGGNENYYDGDFGDFDGDGQMDRGLISRYGLLWNRGGGILLPVSTQQVGRAPNTSPSLTGYLFGDEVQIGNDAIQWADIDGDGDLDNLQGGNGEPFTVQVNRRGRFSIKKKYIGSALDIVNIDLERDGDVDFAVAHSFCSDARCGHGCPQQDCGSGTWPREFHLWVNDGNGNLTDEAQRRGLNIGANLIVGVVAGDVDGDADFDLLLLSGCSDGTTAACVTPGMTRGISLARNDGAGFFTLSPIPFATPVRPIGPITSGFNQGMNLGDIDDDGDLDLVCALDRDVAPHPGVGHAIFINDGTGILVEESASRFEVGSFTGHLEGGNGKLVDIDHDNDLDFIAFQRDKNRLHLLLNDGTGHFIYDPENSVTLPGEPTALGNDTDITDIDGDGAYDIWVGSAATIVHPLINTHVPEDGMPADMPRDAAITSIGSAVTIAFSAPPFAANVRHYRVYRSLAPGIAVRDRLLWKTIAISAHEDEGFAAPITRHTTTEYLGDPEVAIDGERIEYSDAAVAPGITYYYSIAHVGTENTVSRPTAELVASIASDPEAADDTPPLLNILSPDAEWWSPHPRIVLEFADGGSGTDPASLFIAFDKALGTGDEATGGAPAGSDISHLFHRKDENAYVHALDEDQGLPPGLVNMSVRVADTAGNVVEKEVTFNVIAPQAGSPSAVFDAEPVTGQAPLEVRFVGGSSSDAGGAILRWEWYFGDGEEGMGPEASHTYDGAGAYEATLLVRDNDGRVSTARRTITVSSSEAAMFRRGDSNCDGQVDISDPIATLTWLFLAGPNLCCMDAADANGDSEVDVSDPVYLLLWKFTGGTEPPAPGPFDCGPGAEASDCVAYPASRC